MATINVTVTTAAQIISVTFNFDKPVPWSTLNGGNPPNFAFTTNGSAGKSVNLATGAVGTLTNIVNNGIGYGLSDNMLYGSQSGRTDAAGSTVALNYPANYGWSTNFGDCDADSHLITPNTLFGDTLIYTVTLANSGNTTATNVYFQDTVPDGTSFIPETVYVNGKRKRLGAY